MYFDIFIYPIDYYTIMTTTYVVNQKFEGTVLGAKSEIENNNMIVTLDPQEDKIAFSITYKGEQLGETEYVDSVLIEDDGLHLTAFTADENGELRPVHAVGL